MAEQNQPPVVAPIFDPAEVATLKMKADNLMLCMKELRSGENHLKVSKSLVIDVAGPLVREEASIQGFEDAWRLVAAEYTGIANYVSETTNSGVEFKYPDSDSDVETNADSDADVETNAVSDEEVEFMEQFLNWALQKYGGEQVDGQANAQGDREVIQAQADHCYERVDLKPVIIMTALFHLLCIGMKRGLEKK